MAPKSFITGLMALFSTGDTLYRAVFFRLKLIAPKNIMDALTTRVLIVPAQ